VVRYSFPTVEELDEIVRPLFGAIEHRAPGYPWGECFPTLVMRA